jgi:hypothetical protein
MRIFVLYSISRLYKSFPFLVTATLYKSCPLWAHLSYKSLSSLVTPTPFGRAIAQTVSRRLPTAVARVWSQVRLCGICGRQSSAGAGFLRVLRFPLPILIPPTASHSSSYIIRCWYNRPVSGRRTKWTQSCPTRTFLGYAHVSFAYKMFP